MSDLPFDIHYDTEFVEDGTTIDLISIGAVAENGSEFYAISNEFDWARAEAHEFVGPNVLPYLPRRKVLNGGPPDAKGNRTESYRLEDRDERVMSRAGIATAFLDWVHVVLDEAKVPFDPGYRVRLWADVPAYDHVALMQLWGPMMAKPRVLPYTTFDLNQLFEARDVDEYAMAEALDGQRKDAHDALADARWNKLRYDWVHRNYGWDFWFRGEDA